MDHLKIIITLMFAAAILVGLGQKLRLPYPLVLVLGGAAIGFIPGLPQIDFNPNTLLLVVLPPILYYAAFGISSREFSKNWREIFSLALGLVIVTTLIVGILFKWLFPQFPWALAFAFGAIVAPPDAVAATTILKRFAIGSRLLTVLEGESLINDASALVLYRLALIALLSGTFSIHEASAEFVKVVSGGVIIGVIFGYLLQKFSKNYLDPIVGVVFSFTIPYITFITADFFEVSGVLAVVVNGLIGSKILLKHHSSLRRVLGFAAWDIFNILMNCFVFILIGLQLRNIAMVFSNEQMLRYSAYAVLIAFVMIAVRMLWVYAKSALAYLQALRDVRTCDTCGEYLREAPLMGWSGMRGIVSLTAALAIPIVDGRNEVIFITFIVILLTLLIPGFTLSTLIRWLKIHHRDDTPKLFVREELAKIAEEEIFQMQLKNNIDQEEYDFLKSYFQLQRKVMQISFSDKNEMQNLESARLQIIQAQRRQLQEMWDRHEIDDKFFTSLEHELDVEETHMARAELK